MVSVSLASLPVKANGITVLGAAGCVASKAVFDPTSNRGQVDALPCHCAPVSSAGRTACRANPAAQNDIAEDDADRGELAAQPEVAAPSILNGGPTSWSEAGAWCGSSGRRDLCGGRQAIADAVPTRKLHLLEWMLTRESPGILATQ
jgi:hypothetical protein